MRLALALLSASAALAGPVAAPFPQTFAGSVRVALTADPFYASRLVTGVDARVADVAKLTTAADVRKSLEASALGRAANADELKALLAQGKLDAPRAASLLVANALARPDQFREILDRLESVKPGLGARLAERMSAADGTGDRGLIAALRAAGARKPQPANAIYTRDGRLDALFDGAGGTDGVLLPQAPAVPAQEYTGYGADGRPRGSGLAPSAPAPAPARKPMPFPSLSMMLAESAGLTRPPRAPLKPLEPRPDPDALPRGVLGTILMRMAARQNWGDVSYAASNIDTIEGKVRAQWMYEDSKADVNEYLAQLTQEQRRIAEAAFRGGLAETPAFRDAPDPVTLAWVEKNYPARPGR